jgi:hypothetical protein
MASHRHLILLVVTCLGCVPPVCMTGCGPSIQSTRLAPDRQVRTTPAEIRTASMALPECPFEELALITVRETFDFHGPAVLTVMKEEAARMGGDALIGLTQVPRAPKVGSKGLSATVVRFTSDGCRW